MLWTAFIMGLFGGLHCVGMCGPIALALPKRDTLWSNVSGKLVYNIGRGVTYSFLGLLIGFFGTGIALAGFQQSVSVFSGAVMILIVLFTGFKGLEVTFFKPIVLLTARLKRLFSKYLKQKSTGASFMIGLVNGLLPCGLVYLALAASLAAGSLAGSVAYMAVFATGTFPIMMAIALGGGFISISFRRKAAKAIPVFVFAIGLLFILRGLNLGIPYVSPKLTQQTEFKMCLPE